MSHSDRHFKFHIFGFVHNKKSFPMVNIAPSLVPLFFLTSYDCYVTLYLNPEIQLSYYTLTHEHHLYVRALLNRSLRAHSAQQLNFHTKCLELFLLKERSFFGTPLYIVHQKFNHLTDVIGSITRISLHYEYASAVMMDLI